VPPARQHPDEPEARAHVPVLAAGLPDVRVGHPDPLVVGRGEQHALDEEPGGLLTLGLRGEVSAQHPQVLRQLVSQGLEVTEVEEPRAGAAGGGGRRGDLRVCRADGGAHLAFELGDLRAQRATGRGLVRLGDDRPEADRML
jgi:hypothetical protein